MTRFARLSRSLRAQGVVPEPLVARGVTTTVMVQGYTLRHVMMSSSVLAVAAVALALGALSQSGYWIADAHDRATVVVARTAGVDLSAFSPDDVHARFIYSAAQGRMLADLTAKGGHLYVADVADWLWSLQTEERLPALNVLASLANLARTNPARFRFVEAALTLDSATVEAVTRDWGEMSALLTEVAKLSPSDRRLVIDAGLPIKPADPQRARLWQIVNAPSFPAAELVEPLAILANAFPERIHALRRFLLCGAALPTCRGRDCPTPDCDPSSTQWLRP